MHMCEKVFRLQKIADINGFSFFLFIVIAKKHIFISYTDNCDCSTWEIENIDKYIRP